MVQSFLMNGRMRYGSGSPRERQGDSGSPASEQHGQERLRVLAKRYGINRKPVAKWKKRTSVADLPTGPKKPHSTVLSLEEEAIIVTSLLATARHQPVARWRRRQAGEEEVQSLADRRSGIFSDQWRSCPHSTSTSPRCRRPKASCACSWPSTGLCRTA